MEIFDKSPIGIILCDVDGKLVDANQSAFKITGIPEDASDIDIFEMAFMAQKKATLIEEGSIRFQAPFDFGNMESKAKTSKSGDAFIDWNISVLDSGFLVQIQEVTGSTYEEFIKENERYRHWFEEDLTGDFIATLEGKVIECNPAFAEIYGFDNYEQAVKADISNFNPSDWENLIKNLKIEHKVQGHQSTHRRPDGGEIHVVSNLVGIFDDSGELIQVKGYVFDDTERKMAEESLKQSEEKYHRLFDEDLTGDFIAKPNGKILECNPAFAEIYGFDDYKTALQWNISQSNSFDWPYMVTRLRREGKIKGFQSWQRRSDGLRIHVVANVVGIFDDSGELIQVKGYVFNDTERKQAEEKLANAQNQIKEILDSIQDGFVALSSCWNFIYVNQSAGEYFGAEPEDIVGENIWGRFPELLGTKFESNLRRAMDEQETKYFEASDINGTGGWFGFSVYPSVDGISIYWRDINLKI